MTFDNEYSYHIIDGFNYDKEDYGLLRSGCINDKQYSYTIHDLASLYEVFEALIYSDFDVGEEHAEYNAGYRFKALQRIKDQIDDIKK
jgi:hypothetical protein